MKTPPRTSVQPLAGIASATLLLLSAASLVANPRTIVYVDNTAGNDITLVDAETRQAIGTIDTGPAPHGLAASTDGTRLYVTSEGEEKVMAIDTATSTVIWNRGLSGRPNELAVSADGRYLYIPIRSYDYEEVIDTQTRSAVKMIKVGSKPHNTYRGPSGKYIYATAMSGSNVSVIDPATQSVVGTIPVPGEPRPAVITNDDRFIYVELTGLHGFVVGDIAAQKVVATVSFPPADVSVVSTYGYTPSHGMALNPANTTLWITNVYGNAVEAVSVPDHKLLGSVPVGVAPNWMDFQSDGKLLFVTNPGSNDVSVIDSVKMREVARIPVGLAPKRIVVVNVPNGMAPGEAGWTKAAARPPTTDYYLKDGGVLSCETSSFSSLFQDGQLTAESAPAFYRKLGVRGIELDAAYVRSWDSDSLDRIARAVHAENRTLTALNVGGNLVSDDLEANQRQIDEDKRLMAAARYLGIPIVCVGLGNTGKGEAADSTVGVERAVWALRQLMLPARELGVRIAFENGDGPAKTPDRIIKIIQGTDPMWIGLCLNFGNWESQDALRAAVPKLAPYVYNTHLAVSDFDRFGNESTIDYTSALSYLGKGGYGSALSIGFSGAMDPVKGVAGMRDLLVKLWIGKGVAPRTP